MEATRYVAEHSRANIMVVEDEEQYAKVGFLIHYYLLYFFSLVVAVLFWIQHFK
jgi:hypothetical protein